jgi:hypothetical protein
MAATGIESQITEALLQRLAALTLSPALQVAYPGITFPAAGATKPATYLEARAPLRVGAQNVGISAWSEHSGVFQVDVLYSAQDGAIKPTQIADAVVAWFDRPWFAELASGGRVSVLERPAIGPAIDDAPYTRTPVSIRYRTFVR